MGRHAKLLCQNPAWIRPENIHTHTHTRLTARYPGLPGWAGTRKVKPIWILLKQETVSGSGCGISWTICKSEPCSRQITTPAPHHSVFLQARCPSCRPTSSIKALFKAHICIISQQKLGVPSWCLPATRSSCSFVRFQWGTSQSRPCMSPAWWHSVGHCHRCLNTRHSTPTDLSIYSRLSQHGGSVACWTQAQKGLGSNRSHDAVR